MTVMGNHSKIIEDEVNITKHLHSTTDSKPSKKEQREDREKRRNQEIKRIKKGGFNQMSVIKKRGG
jgi:hypothetical protein